MDSPDNTNIANCCAMSSENENSDANEVEINANATDNQQRRSKR